MVNKKIYKNSDAVGDTDEILKHNFQKSFKLEQNFNIIAHFQNECEIIFKKRKIESSSMN